MARQSVLQDRVNRLHALIPGSAVAKTRTGEPMLVTGGLKVCYFADSKTYKVYSKRPVQLADRAGRQSQWSARSEEEVLQLATMLS